MMAFLVLFVLATLLVFHSYVLFPAHMKRLAQKQPNYPPLETWPSIEVLMAAYNEVAVIEAKVHSVLGGQYPADKLILRVGSDASTDGTDECLAQLTQLYPGRLLVQRFEARTGKPNIINALATQVQSDLLVITDADALFEPDTLLELVKPFADAQVGGVQAHADIRITGDEAVARQEASYTAREMTIKAGEGSLGAVIGGFGAAYAIRRNLFTPVPKGFIVDDFFSFADLSRQGYRTVFQASARTSLGVSGDQRVQFRRKRRIGKGNFQNLRHFASLLNPFTAIGYVFWSHKALRWLTPALLFVAWLSAGLGADAYGVLQWAFWGMNAALLLALTDLALRPWGISSGPLRFLSHFLLMNLALLLGFIDSLGSDEQVFWNNEPD